MKRRFFLFAAPAIVAAPSLMRVSTLPAALAATDWLDLRPIPDPREWSKEFHRMVLREAMRTNRLLQSLGGITPEMLGIVDGKAPRIDRTPIPGWTNAAINPLTS